jgi:predicted metal-binding membrane protein
MTSAAVALRLRTLDAPSIALIGAIAGAWGLLIGADATGTAPAFHHHALIENGPPLPVAVGLFLGAWLVMVVAMMLPASLVVGRAGLVSPSVAGSRWRGSVVFVAGFLGVWAVFGLAAFAGDMVVHRVVDATPWLAARPWLIEAGVLAVAGAVQFAPLTRHSLDACRHGAAVPAVVQGPPLRAGLRHGLDCLGASWALMLLMFAEGFDSLVWMLTLTALMTWQVAANDGRRATVAAGIVLLLASVSVLAGAGPARG